MVLAQPRSCHRGLEPNRDAVIMLCEPFLPSPLVAEIADTCPLTSSLICGGPTHKYTNTQTQTQKLHLPVPLLTFDSCHLRAPAHDSQLKAPQKTIFCHFGDFQGVGTREEEEEEGVGVGTWPFTPEHHRSLPRCLL